MHVRARETSCVSGEAPPYIVDNRRASSTTARNARRGGAAAAQQQRTPLLPDALDGPIAVVHVLQVRAREHAAHDGTACGVARWSPPCDLLPEPVEHRLVYAQIVPDDRKLLGLGRRFQEFAPAHLAREEVHKLHVRRVEAIHSSRLAKVDVFAILHLQHAERVQFQPPYKRAPDKAARSEHEHRPLLLRSISAVERFLSSAGTDGGFAAGNREPRTHCDAQHRDPKYNPAHATRDHRQRCTRAVRHTATLTRELASPADDSCAVRVPRSC